VPQNVAQHEAVERASSRGCGPACPPETVIVYREYESDGEPILDEEKPLPSCPRCGRPADVTEIRVIRDPNFYGNTDRLIGEMT